MSEIISGAANLGEAISRKAVLQVAIQQVDIFYFFNSLVTVECCRILHIQIYLN